MYIRKTMFLQYKKSCLIKGRQACLPNTGKWLLGSLHQQPTDQSREVWIRAFVLELILIGNRSLSVILTKRCNKDQSFFFGPACVWFSGSLLTVSIFVWDKCFFLQICQKAALFSRVVFFMKQVVYLEPCQKTVVVWEEITN